MYPAGAEENRIEVPPRSLTTAGHVEVSIGSWWKNWQRKDLLRISRITRMHMKTTDEHRSDVRSRSQTSTSDFRPRTSTSGSRS